jgi:hypothetical protein
VLYCFEASSLSKIVCICEVTEDVIRHIEKQAIQQSLMDQKISQFIICRQRHTHHSIPLWWKHIKSFSHPLRSSVILNWSSTHPANWYEVFEKQNEHLKTSGQFWRKDRLYSSAGCIKKINKLREHTSFWIPILLILSELPLKVKPYLKFAFVTNLIKL